MSEFVPFPEALVPTRGAFPLVLDSVKPCIESATAHLFAALCSLFGVTAANVVYFQNGFQRNHLNLWHLAFGPPGSGKTSAMQLMREFAIRAGITPFSFPTTTVEGLIAMAAENREESGLILARQPYGLMMYDEFMSLTNSMTKKWMGGYREALMTSYNGVPFDVATKGGGRHVGRFEGLSLFAATTPGFAKFQAEDIYSGFLARWNIFAVDERSEQINAFPSGIPEVFESTLYPMLTSIRNDNCVIEVSVGARSYYTSWYGYNRRTRETDFRLESFAQRNPEQVMKYAGIFALAEGLREIRAEDIERAVELINWQKANLPIVLGRVGLSTMEFEVAQTKDKIVAKLLKADGDFVLRETLLRDLNLTAARLDAWLAPRIESEAILTCEVETDAGKKRTAYKLKGPDTPPTS